MKKILFIILILLAAGCINKSPQSEKAFISYMNILQEKGEFLQFLGHKGNDGKITEFAPYFVDSAKKIEFQIIETKKDKDRSVIIILIKSPDLGYYDSLPNDPEIDFEKRVNSKIDLMKEALKQKDLKFQEKTISVYMILSKDKQWVLDSIDKNEEFIDIINHKIF